jgi:hypothetical protein
MICPCCSQTVTPPGRLQALVRELGPVSGGILRELLASSESLTPSQIADRVYAGVAGGGPVGATNVVRQMVHRMKPRLKEIGWTIRAVGWSGYRLVPLPAPAEA